VGGVVAGDADGMEDAEMSDERERLFAMGADAVLGGRLPAQGEPSEAEVEAMLDAALNIRAEGMRLNNGTFGPPWEIIDTSTAEPEVNWPGEWLDETNDPGEVRALLRKHMVAAALRAAREARHD
jgi:hypothetical protein